MACGSVTACLKNLYELHGGKWMQLIDCVTTFCKFHFHLAGSSYPAGV